MTPIKRIAGLLTTLFQRRPDLLIGLGVFASTFALYVATLAPGLVFGDPAEYTFVPHIWGISHPPGYAFQTVLGGIWQRLVPVGSIAYRANLLSAAAGAGIAALVYGSVRALTHEDSTGLRTHIPALLGAASAATATDLWQHSLHANAHIVTAQLATASLFALIQWWRSTEDRWLYAFCVLAGLSVTHHPLLAFSFPAYATFVVAVRPRILLDWRALLRMAGFALLGLSVWLYLPIRASLPAPLLFGPDNTNTLSGFLDLVMARGLRVNLFHFGLADQPDRWLVFASLLELQAGLAVIALMGIGLIWVWRRAWRVGLLLTAFLLVNLLFVLNTIQDVMAYLMPSFAALMVLAGLGAIPVFGWVRLRSARETRLLHAALSIVLLGLPAVRAVYLTPTISLRGYTEAQDWIAEVYARFEGSGEHAVLLGHWEYLTPLWYEAWVEDHPLDERDVKLVFVATTSARPWVDNMWANIDAGPIYVSGYQRELIEEGFRLRPIGPKLYRVLPPPADAPAPMGIALNAQAGPLTVVGADLRVTAVFPGAKIPLSLALASDDPLPDIIFPYAKLGEDVIYQFTTDSHLLTPDWGPGEMIVERYDLRAPYGLEPGEYPLRIGLRNLSAGGEALRFADGSTEIEIGTIILADTVISEAPTPEEMIADINHEAGLVAAVGSARGQRRVAPWSEPIRARSGDDVRLRLTWIALSRPTDNYKVFVHLVSGANQVIAQQDAPPLGGAFPTFLWFPKWVPGQTVIDPYRLTIPEGTPPGEYRIEVGMYGFTTFQRAPFYDPQGNLSGDYFILGTVVVEP